LVGYAKETADLHIELYIGYDPWAKEFFEPGLIISDKKKVNIVGYIATYGEIAGTFNKISFCSIWPLSDGIT